MPLLNLVEHACSVGMLGTVRGGGAECGLISLLWPFAVAGYLVDAYILALL